MRLIRGFFFLVYFSLMAGAQGGANLIRDPSFEEGVHEPFSTNWIVFNNAYCEAVTPRTRFFSAKVFGRFTNEKNWSGVYQDVPAQAGQQYVASVYARQNTHDSLTGANAAWIKVEYYDAGRTLLRTVESPVRLKANSPSGKYLLLSTGPSRAPEGTVLARVVLLFEQQSDNAAGAVFFDDVSLVEAP